MGTTAVSQRNGAQPVSDQSVGEPVTVTESDFRDLFNATYTDVLAYARRRSFNVSDADDVVGEVYATAWRRRDSMEPGASPLPWLYGIASNVLRNQWRAGGRRLQLVERLEAQPAPSPMAVHTADPADSDGDEIRAALAQLSFDDQEVLRLVAWEGLAHAEVGQVLGCSTNAVGIRLHRAKQRLATELERTSAESNPEHTTEDDQPRGGESR